MPIVAADIVVYGSASMPDDDTPTGIGGAIDTSVLLAFTDLTADDTVDAVSDNAGDTSQTITFYGRNAAGEIVSEAETMNGTTPVATSTIFERILKITLSVACAGDVTVADVSASDTIIVIPAGVTEVRRPFYNAAAEAATGSARNYYEKVFIKNDHGSLTLTEAVLSLTDATGNISFDLESSLDGTDNNGAGNRQTHTGGYSFGTADHDYANSKNLTAGSAQGVWLRLNLPAGEAAANTNFTLQTTGQTV